MPEQLDLFAHVTTAYADARGTLDNATLYRTVAERCGIDGNELQARVPIGTSGTLHNPVTRRIRWMQQTLKRLGVIEHVEGQRGVWRLAEQVGKDLHRATAGVRLVAFHTGLGMAIWSRHEDVFPRLGEPITLCVSSPPYPLRRARAYGNPSAADYVDFLCTALSPIVHDLVPGGSIVLNLTNDSFEAGSPARSLYLERLTLALHERLGLFLMDRIPWVNLSKPPGPTWWACVHRVQLTSAYEPVLWFTNDPLRVRSDNRRVLEAHTERHRALMHRGGAGREATYGDGAYQLRTGSYGKVTAGKIPRNVLHRGHVCSDTATYRSHVASLQLPSHGAMQPTAIPDFFIRLLSEPDELVVDPFGGTTKTGLAAERLGRRWIVTEWVLQYLRGAAEMYRAFPAFHLHPALVAVGGKYG